MTSSIHFTPNLKPGQIKKNSDLINIFKCSCEGGIRYSTKTNTIVLIDNQYKSLYPNIWIGNTLEYIGQGKSGNQTLTRMNKRLYEFLNDKKDVYLFEVTHPGEYIFKGKVELADKPYQKEIYENDASRKVWVFPIKLIA